MGEAQTAARHAVEMKRLNKLLPLVDPALFAKENGLDEETVSGQSGSGWGEMFGNVMAATQNLISMIKNGDEEVNRFLRTTDEATGITSPKPTDTRRRRLLEAEH